MVIKYFIILVIIIPLLSLAQETEKTLKVNNYINLLKKYQDNQAAIKKLNDEEFKEVLRTIYQAKEVAPMELNKIFNSDHDRWEKELEIKKDKDQVKVKYGIVEGAIVKEIERRYSKTIYILTRIRYI